MGWLDFLFGSKKVSRPEPLSKQVQVSDWQADDACNGLDFAKLCYRRGRYELAAQFREMGIKWYNKHVFLATPKEERSYYRDYLKEFKSQLKQFPLLIETRDAILTILKNYPESIDRAEIVNQLNHKADFKFTVVCNQLEKGGWIQQKRKGRKVRFFFCLISLLQAIRIF